VAAEGREEEAVTRLSRVGFDRTLGYLEGGFKAWKAAAKEYDTVSTINVRGLKKELEENRVQVYDVRKESEYLSEHLEGALNTPLDFLNEHLAAFPDSGTFYLHCGSGYRSMIAASILKSRGIHNLVNVNGGIAAMKEAGLPLTAYVCPSTLK